MNTAIGIAATVAASSVAFAAGVLWPDLRRRREKQVDESGLMTPKVVQLPAPAPERLVRDLQLPTMEVAEEIAVTIEPVREVVFDAPDDEPAVEKILTKHQRRSKRNGGGRRRRRGHGRR